MEEWERQPGESSQAFEAFVTYRDMGAQRSIRSAASRLGKSHKLLERWSARFKWGDRAAAFDAHMDSIAVMAQEGARREMAERQAKIGMDMQELAAQSLDGLAAGGLTVNEVVRMMETGVKIERAARGCDDAKPRRAAKPAPMPEFKVIRYPVAVAGGKK